MSATKTNRTKTSRTRRNKTVSFVGAGALASGLARLLHARGYAIGEIIARSETASQRRARTLARPLKAAATTLADARLTCDVLWIAVPDGAIEQTARGIAKKLAAVSDQAMGSPRSAALPRVVLHASGALSSHSLRSLAELRIETGSAHPMMTFVAGEPPDLEGAWFAVEGTPAAVRAARAVAHDLGANSFRIEPASKTLYHAFGAMLSPMLASELEAAERIGLRAGIEPRLVRRIMEPIVLRTVRNVLRNGAGMSFSGPLARGDVRTVAGHLEALKDDAEGRVYRALVEYAIEVLPVKQVDEMTRLLRQSSGQHPQTKRGG